MGDGSNTAPPAPDFDAGSEMALKASDPPLPAAIESALAKVPDKAARSTLTTALSVAISRTSFGFGPDAETMKIMAETEVHEETCRLDGFRASLANRDKQGDRDHDFRKRQLNHQTALTILVVLVGTALIGFGIYISVSSQNQLGGYLIIGGAAILFNSLGIKGPTLPKG